MNNISDLNPKVLWRNFQSLCDVPHASKHEGQAVKLVIDFADKHHLQYKTDNVGNVVVLKSATIGYEDKPIIVIQSHLDMVPQKNESTVHNFETDSIQTYADDGWVRAKGTTLGSDNGIGVAAGLALLESTDIQHGPLEVLFTVDEETDMTGAYNLSDDFIRGRILLNLDSEDEGEIFIGSAGGVNLTANFDYISQPSPVNYAPFQISLTGLRGGHSGVDIIKGYGNANKIMNSLLLDISQKFGSRIASINGGSLQNAIPRESFVVLLIPIINKDSFIAYINEFGGKLVSDLSKVEPNIRLQIDPVNLSESVIDIDTQNQLLNAIDKLPNGVIAMSQDMPEIVETSTNLAIIKSSNNKIEVVCSLRSSDDFALADLRSLMSGIIESASGNVQTFGLFPTWRPDMKSPILQIMVQAYQNKFGILPKVKIIHAGLECGIIGNKYPGMDMVSIGPTIRNPHSPDEKVNIESVEKFWLYLIEVLKTI